MLSDCLLCGVNDGKIQQALMPEKTLMQAKAMEVTEGLETAAKNVKMLTLSEGAISSETVHQVMPAAGHQRKNARNMRHKFTGACLVVARLVANVRVARLVT